MRLLREPASRYKESGEEEEELSEISFRFSIKDSLLSLPLFPERSSLPLYIPSSYPYILLEEGFLKEKDRIFLKGILKFLITGKILVVFKCTY